MKESDIDIARQALEFACTHGASKARFTLSKSNEDIISTLNGEIDKITSCLDTSLSMALFVDGRFGSFSTNKLDRESLEDFMLKAMDTVRMMAPDGCRDLPSPDICAHDASEGNELDLVDPGYLDIDIERKKRTALDAAVFGSDSRIISEEGEYSDSLYETVVIDSNGLLCRHAETSFDYGVEITVGIGGDKYSAYWWHADSRLEGLDYGCCGRTALAKALAQEGSGPMRSGRYNMVVSSDVASKMVSPILNALNGYSLQQNNSFLLDSLGKKVFPEGLTIMDVPHIKGQTCSKLFDSEGVATSEVPIIEKGVVSRYFINTYMSHKLQTAQTTEEATRPRVMPWPRPGLDTESILRICRNGILVTDFNGGNSNSATGDFSYGVEGFHFRNGKIDRPVSGMLVTGNFIDIWSRLIAIGDDARPCMSKLIPTLAFSKADFSG